MNPVSTDVKDLIEGSTFDLTYAVNLFEGTLPATPDNCVGIFDAPGREQISDIQYFRPGLNIRVRNKSYSAGYALAESLQNYLHGLANVEINSTRYILFFQQGSIIPLGRDDHERAEWSINFRVQRTPAT